VIHTVNPVTQQPLSQYALTDEEAIQKQLSSMQHAYAIWKIKPVEARVSHLETLAVLLAEQEEALAKLITQEMGKPLAQSRKEIQKCIQCCEYYADASTEILCDEYLEYYRITYQPLGIILGIMPWNFPFWQVFRFAVPTLMTGNACLIKHADNVSGCALALEALFEEAGFQNVLKTVFCSIDTTQALIAHNAVKGVSITGSIAAGKATAKTAGEHLKPCVLELGGNDGYYIHHDVENIMRACQNVIEGRLINSGQSCISPKRIFIHKNIFDLFKSTLINLLEQYPAPNDPMLLTTKVGPLARGDLLEHLSQQVETLLEKGAKIIFQSQIPDHGFYFPITVLELPKNVHIDEELFGPIFCIQQVENEEIGINAINQSQFGLGSGIFMKDSYDADDMAKFHIDAGLVGVNRYVFSTPELPFGGIKNSGIGRELSENALMNFCNTKVIMHDAPIL
jgi:succinate-semialdehyde dehydrogenase/glutarate-semialdehyde dehydrogenase